MESDVWDASEVAEAIGGEQYCYAYAKSGNLQELIQELWYAGKDGESVRKVIKKCHADLNDWCERSNKHPVPMLKDRQSYLSGSAAKKFIKSKKFPKGFILDKTPDKDKTASS